ncbi:MAG: gamma-glutamyl-gamma-aminobutyrate hydrolase family protein [SAR324 cluster bacterium]|nr:gamma-glutamyl-gamma-aminobutyrate hydrolase family protein [SAR324 cluster bacterium]
MKKPLIAVVSYSPNQEGRYYLPKAYIESIRGSGGTPLVILPGEQDAQEIEDIYNVVDGILLAGGGDISPNLYGGDYAKDNIYGVSNERDQTEFELTKIALKNDKPILAICRGLQVVNILLGGDLVADLADDKWLEHRERQDKGLEHAIKLTDSTVFNHLNIYTDQKMDILSWHHQAINRLGEGLEAVAFSPDNIIEACVLPSHKWFLGLQWHPEITFSKDENQRKIFKSFIDEAKN